MNINDLKSLAQNRIWYLGVQRETAVNKGDADEVTRLEADIAETQATLNELNQLG
jgi:hypothetical protein